MWFQLFHTRYALHKRAYQHRVSNAVEEMLAEALILADPFVTIPGKNGAPRKMSECVDDLHAYWRLTEYILHVIEHSVQPVRFLCQKFWCLN
jgi:HD superfamily phosphohydrolase